MTDRLVSVAVPVAVDRAFTYRVPEERAAPPGPGCRVLVPFGSRALVGVVRPAEADVPEKIRELLDVLDPPDAPALGPDLLALCEWIAEYYVAPVGEVYRLALPGLLTNADARHARITAEGRDALVRAAGGPLLAGDAVHLEPAGRRLLEALSEAPSRGLAVSRVTRLKPRIPGALGLLSRLEDRGWAETTWADATGGEARTETHFRRTDYLRGVAADEDTLQAAVGRSKQRRALLDYLDGQPGDGWISVAELRGPFPRVRQLTARLLEAGLVASEERLRALNPFETGTPEPTEPQTPTPDQSAALEQLGAAVRGGEYATALLQGITGSGKTEVYLQLIARTLEDGGGAIVLVPEIALTPQLADRFRARFGERVAVLHSGLTPRQRHDAWQQIRDGERSIVIGARSAIFAPVPRLRVIVVDEEHDGSFKQEDGVRYNARDVALVRARHLDALVVLGSATPSLETYENAREGRYLHLHLNSRPTPRPLPTVELLPMAVHRPDPESLLSSRLKQALQETVEAREQAILFLNRRGFATSLQCNACGSFQQCPDCSAPSMTYHLGRNRLMCHLCGHIEGAPETCPTCGNGELVHGGVGTERVEVAIGKQLPGVRVLRLDRDTSRGTRLLDTLARFRRREADVLVGTQMLSKGHDFPGVTLVGILQADHGLGLPDPRASERVFQLLTQVAGRAGRGDRAGRVLAQAYAVKHPAVTHAASHDYEGFAAAELRARAEIGNPPFGYLALIRVSGPDEAAVRGRAESLAAALRGGVASVAAKHPEDPPPLQLLGPVQSPIARINRRSRWQLLLRGAQRAPLRWILGQVRPALGSGPGDTLAIADVDPQTLL